jgi:dihydroorotase
LTAKKVFIDTVLQPLIQRFPRLKLVMEHITTRDAAEFVANSPSTVAATITAHHLLYNRNAIFQGGVRPHWYCLPVLKRETHRQALVAAAVSGNPKFFLGTDSAPHAKQAKEAACGCAGCYTAYAAIELYAEAFEAAGALDKLEAFASFNGPDWYGLPRNSGTITLAKENWTVPAEYSYIAADTIVPLRAGETLSWKML